jgi:hypothetical protein
MLFRLPQRTVISMGALYKDRWIECTADAVLIRGYYFPWGTKRVPYESIREVGRVPTGLGRGRIWGSTTLSYWANLDPGRPGKKTALILDTGRAVLPYITPDDPDAVAAVISAHSSATVVDGPAKIP